MGFFRRSKKPLDSLPQKSRVVNPYQKQLNGFQAPPQEKPPTSTRGEAIRKFEDEIYDELKAFESYVKEVKETSLKLDELAKMLKSGEITENMYKIVMDEMGDRLSKSVEEIFNLREALEVSKTKAKLEWAKEKIGLREFATSKLGMKEPEKGGLKEDYYMRGLYSPQYSPVIKWEELISKIDASLSSLPINEEVSIIEQYLSLMKERLSSRARTEEAERCKAICRERLDSISDKWTSLRRDKIEQIMNLELKDSQIKEDVKEAEVRFSIGELDQESYEYRMSSLQGSLKNIEKEISEVRKYIDETDMKMFRCTELFGEKP